MNPQDHNFASLWDMREAASLINEFLQGMNYAQFIDNRLMRSAVERQLEIISLAAGLITPEFQNAHPEIPWRSIVGLRNLLTNGYGEVRADRIWLLSRTNLPQLVTLLNPLVPVSEDMDQL